MHIIRYAYHMPFAETDKLRIFVHFFIYLLFFSIPLEFGLSFRFLFELEHSNRILYRLWVVRTVIKKRIS